MVEIKSHEFAPLARRRPIPYPIVLIFGPDRGLVAERAAEIAKNSGVDLSDDFSVVRLEASELSSEPGRLVEEACSVSLFGGDRLVWVRNAGSERGIAEAVRTLARDELTGTRILIEAGDLKRSASLRKTVAEAKTGVAVPCYADDPRAIQALIDEELSAAGLSITGEARQRLTAMLGGDRLASRGELRKLALYCHGTGQVTEEDVFEAIGDVAALSVDDAVDAALAGEVARLDQALDRIEKSKLSVFLVLRGMIQQFTLLDGMRAAMESEGKSAAALMAGPGRAIHFKRKPLIERALRNWPLAAIQAELQRLNETVYNTRRRPAIEFPLARNTLIRICLMSARYSGGRR